MKKSDTTPQFLVSIGISATLILEALSARKVTLRADRELAKLANFIWGANAFCLATGLTVRSRFPLTIGDWEDIHALVRELWEEHGSLKAASLAKAEELKALKALLSILITTCEEEA